MDPRDHWQAVYQRKRPEEVSWYQATPAPSLAALDRLGATQAMSLVDIGGGASMLVDALLERGWRDLTVLDIAEPALAASRARLGEMGAEVRWQVADIRDWRPGRRFDVWHDRAVFHFLTDEPDRDGYKRALAEGTSTGSLVLIATFAPDGPAQCSGLPVRRYDAAAMAAELGAGFTLLADWPETHLTPWGDRQSFQWCAFARL